MHRRVEFDERVPGPAPALCCPEDDVGVLAGAGHHRPQVLRVDRDPHRPTARRSRSSGPAPTGACRSIPSTAGEERRPGRGGSGPIGCGRPLPEVWITPPATRELRGWWVRHRAKLVGAALVGEVPGLRRARRRGSAGADGGSIQLRWQQPLGLVRLVPEPRARVDSARRADLLSSYTLFTGPPRISGKPPSISEGSRVAQARPRPRHGINGRCAGVDALGGTQPLTCPGQGVPLDREVV